MSASNKGIPPNSITEAMVQPHMRVRRVTAGTFVDLVSTPTDGTDPATELVVAFQYQADPGTVYLEAGGWSSVGVPLTIPAVASSGAANSPFTWTAAAAQELAVDAYATVTVDPEYVGGLALVVRLYRGQRWYDVAASSWTGPDADGAYTLHVQAPRLAMASGDKVALVLRAWTAPPDVLAPNDPWPVEILGAEMRGLVL